MDHGVHEMKEVIGVLIFAVLTATLVTVFIHNVEPEPTATGLQAYATDEAGCLHYTAAGVSDYWRNYEVIICPDGARTVEIAQ
jgi:hypothetical protein